MSNIPKEFNHPCKNTCSGWQQGFDRGLEQSAQKIAELEKELIDLKVKMGGVCGATVGSIVSDYKSQLANSIPREDVEKLITCLKFYAEENNHYSRCPPSEVDAITQDNGAAARRILEDFEAKHGGGNEST